MNRRTLRSFILLLGIFSFVFGGTLVLYSSPQDGTYYDGLNAGDRLYSVKAFSADSRLVLIEKTEFQPEGFKVLGYLLINLNAQRETGQITKPAFDSGVSKGSYKTNNDAVYLDYKGESRNFTISPDMKWFVYQEYKKNSRMIITNKTAAEIYNRNGLSLYKKKKYDDALYFFKEAVKYKSDYARGIFNIACMYGVMNDAENAVKYLEMLKSLNNSDSKKFLNLVKKEKDFNSIRKTGVFINFVNGL